MTSGGGLTGNGMLEEPTKMEAWVAGGIAFVAAVWAGIRLVFGIHEEVRVNARAIADMQRRLDRVEMNVAAQHNELRDDIRALNDKLDRLIERLGD